MGSIDSTTKLKCDAIRRKYMLETATQRAKVKELDILIKTLNREMKEFEVDQFIEMRKYDPNYKKKQEKYYENLIAKRAQRVVK